MIDFHVKLSFDDAHILLPQKDIRVAEVIDDVKTDIVDEEAGAGIVGWLHLEGHDFPAFCIDKNFQLMNYIPESRQLCVLLSTGSDAIFGITCDQIESLNNKPFVIKPIPACMKTPDSPIEQIAIYNNEIAVVTDAIKLVSYISSLGEESLV